MKTGTLNVFFVKNNYNADLISRNTQQPTETEDRNTETDSCYNSDCILNW